MVLVSDFYHLDYLTKPLSRRSSQRSAQSTSPRTSRFPARRPGKKLNLALVEDPLLAMLSSATPASPTISRTEQPGNEDTLDVPAKLPDTPMQDQFMDDPFEYVYAEPKADVDNSHLVTHAKVYAIAEK